MHIKINLELDLDPGDVHLVHLAREKHKQNLIE